MKDKPTQCFLSGCPLAITCDCGHKISDHAGEHKCTVTGCACVEFVSKGKGFVLDSGDPSTAQFAILLEAPGHEEVAFSLTRKQDQGYWSDPTHLADEIAIRQRDYPTMPLSFIKKGVPVVGKSGSEMFYWVPAMKNISRGDIYISNALRCLPPKDKKSDSQYPTGNERKRAEGCCQQYSRLNPKGGFNVTVSTVSLHPAAVLREPTPLRLQAKNFEKAFQFIAQGERVLVLAGGKAAKLWLGYAENVTRWQGHFQFENGDIQRRRAERFAEWSLVDTDKKTTRSRSAKSGSRSVAGRTRKSAIKTTVSPFTVKTHRKKKVTAAMTERSKMREFAMSGEDTLMAPHLIKRVVEEELSSDS